MMLSLKNVCKTTTNSKKQLVKVLSNVNLEIRQGDFVCIQGANGAGKSAIVNIIGARDLDFEGEYYIDGIELSRYTAKQLSSLRLEKFGFVPENLDLFEKLSIEDNVGLVCKYAKVKRADKQAMIEKALNSVGLSSAILSLKPNDLSSGQQQRVMIARSLVLEPKVLIIDNPTARLDEDSANLVLNLLNRLNKDGVTIIAVSNDERYLFKAKRVFTVSRGMIVENMKVTRGKNMGEVIGIDQKVQEKKPSGVRKTVIQPSKPASGISIGEVLAQKEDEEKVKEEQNKKVKPQKESQKNLAEQLKIEGLGESDIKEEEKGKKTSSKTTQKQVKPKKTTEVNTESSELMIQAVKSGRKRTSKW